MRLVHTADIHLDACFASSSMPTRVANRRRQSLRDVLHTIVQRAAAWPADALLIPGDLYDHERVSRDTIAFLRSEFEAAAPLPILIAPGNHDPYMAGSPYASETWPDNVHIFTRPVWTPVRLLDDQLCVHGFAFDGFDISSNPFGTLAIPDDGAVHVAMGHGSERAHQPPDGKSYAPFDAADAAPPGLAYFALGHFHRVTEIRGNVPCPMYYCGAPEGHGFDEPGPRHRLEVEITESGTRVQSVFSARAVYEVRTLDCTSFTTAQQAIDALRDMWREHGAAQIMRVILQGACAPQLVAEFPAVYDVAAPNFEYLDLVDETQPVEDYEELARETSSIGAFVRQLNEEIQDAPDDARRRQLERARLVGIAAYRGDKLPVTGLDIGGETA